MSPKRHRLSYRALVLLFGWVVLARAAVGFATPGSLDPAFGSDGKVTTNFTDESEYATAAVVQPDGNILVAGSFDLVRYRQDGTLDPTFGNAGKITNLNVTSAVDLILLADGTFLTAGARFDVDGLGDAEFALTRFLADGTVDATFGNDGTASVNPGPSEDLAHGAVLQPDGKFILAGHSVLNPVNPTSPGSQVATITRFNADGTLDTGFGIAGVVQTTDVDRAYDVALQPDGKIVVAGRAWNTEGTNMDFAVFRYLPDGSPDDTFGANGLVTADFGDHPDVAEAVLVQSDGKIVAGGVVLSPSPANFDFGLARFHADGTPDVSFGGSGRVATDFPTSDGFGGFDGIKDVILQTDGKLVAVGHGHSSELPFSMPPAAAVARYLPDGALDPEFGTAGRVTVDFYEEPDQFLGATLQSDGRIIAVGVAQNSGSPFDDFAVARLFAEDPSTGVGGPPGGTATLLRVHPNPARDAITIEPRNIEPAFDVFAYDVSGRLVRKWLGQSGRVVWDRNDVSGVRLNAGVYFIEMRAGATAAVHKVVLLD